jgi:predicted  nucleic acid-binding Zn-ribbon protein
MKSNKFIKTLTASNKDIKKARAVMVSEDVLDASEELVRNIRQKKRELERRLMNLSDMNRDSELSLKVVKDNFDAKAWVKEIQEIKIELANIRVELELAEETHNEWFSEDEAEAKDVKYENLS